MVRIKKYNQYINESLDICDKYSKEDIENMLLELKDDGMKYDIIPIHMIPIESNLNLNYNGQVLGSATTRYVVSSGKYRKEFHLDNNIFPTYVYYKFERHPERNDNAYLIKFDINYKLDNFFDQKKETLSDFKIIRNLQIFEPDENNDNLMDWYQTTDFILC